MVHSIRAFVCRKCKKPFTDVGDAVKCEIDHLTDELNKSFESDFQEIISLNDIK